MTENMENNSIPWLIVAKTNLHAGNENTTNYGIVDKGIQRDALTDLPCINSSSLKGAISEFCTYKKELDAGKRLEIFGVVKDDKEKKYKTQRGKTIFFDANILLLPVQGGGEINNDALFHYVTTDAILEKCVERMKLFGSEIAKDKKSLLDILKNKFKIDIVFEDQDKFTEDCKEINLPIIARNCLENGESTNLWYEQILPPETVFYTQTQGCNDVIGGALNNEIIQIGANATIGYGYCKFLNIALPNEKK